MPNVLLSIDEVSYFARALAFANGTLDWVQSFQGQYQFSWAPANYPLGTALFLTPFIWIGKDWALLAGLIALVMSIVLIVKICYHLYGQVHIGILTIILFPPTLFFTRSVMSEMPSLLLISGYCWLFFTKDMVQLMSTLSNLLLPRCMKFTK